MPKKKTLYKKSLSIYTLVLIILALTFLIFVYANLKKYENNLLNNVITNAIHKLSIDELKNYLESANQNVNLIDTYQQMIKRDDFKLVNTSTNVYDVYLDNRILFTIKLNSLGEETCLGLLQYEKYEIDSIVPHLERGLIYYTVKMPSNYKLFVNGTVYENITKEEEYENLNFMYYNDAMPKLNTYEINNLESEATIEIENYNGEKVDVKKDGINFIVEDSIKINTMEEASKIIGTIDILEIAKNWSLFLSQDLKGDSYGFTTIRNYLIEGTSMYTLAYNWAHSIDIKFTSKHTLKNPPFSNEKLENFMIYGPNAFSCEVYLEKNMLVSGKYQADIMHDSLSFIKVDNEWKLINIKGI